MEIQEYYKTRDGKEFSSSEQAESHALTQAHNLLKDLLMDSCPFLDNYHEIYKMGQNILLYPGTKKILKQVVLWMENAELDDN